MTEAPSTIPPERRAYHRDQRAAIESALRCARIDQRTLYPPTIPRADWMDRPTDYVATVCWLLDRDTYQQFQERQRQVAEAGEPPQRRLTDYADGGASA